ncbi:MAG: hypothetical protein K6U87_14390 [Firmicutes bacterium]|nr:hypothetical protein [Bacillota bacterium]
MERRNCGACAHFHPVPGGGHGVCAAPVPPWADGGQPRYVGAEETWGDEGCPCHLPGGRSTAG